MALRINTNEQALFITRYLNSSQKGLNKASQRLASGLRINSASDDAAGLQIADSLRSQIKGVEQAMRNTQDGVSLLNTAEGALGGVNDDLQRMRELAVQAANDTLSDSQRSAISTEITQIATNITTVSQSTQFNGKNLLDGSQTSINIQVGPNAGSTANTVNIASVGGVNPFGDIGASSLGLGANGASLTVGSNAQALATISRLDAAIATVNNRRTAAGVMTNRLESTSNNLAIAAENMAAAESRVRDADIARESLNLTRFQILQQAGVSVLAQVGTSPALALNLIGG